MVLVEKIVPEDFGLECKWLFSIPAFSRQMPLLTNPYLWQPFINTHTNEKKNLYNDAVERKRGSFTPIIALLSRIKNEMERWKYRIPEE